MCLCDLPRATGTVERERRTRQFSLLILVMSGCMPADVVFFSFFSRRVAVSVSHASRQQQQQQQQQQHLKVQAPLQTTETSKDHPLFLLRAGPCKTAVRQPADGVRGRPQPPPPPQPPQPRWRTSVGGTRYQSDTTTIQSLSARKSTVVPWSVPDD